MVIGLKEGDTKLSLKKLTPVRLIKNKFFEEVDKAEAEGKSVEELKDLLGRGRAKKGIFEGNLEDGELEIGQVSAQINQILPVSEIMGNIIHEYHSLLSGIAVADKFMF
jgi:enoyl-[acyl-carrier protein] reductase II